MPLNDNALPSPLVGPRVRRGTVGSEDFNDKAAKLRIDASSDRKRYLKSERLSRASSVISPCDYIALGWTN